MLTRHETIVLADELQQLDRRLAATTRRIAQAGGDAIAIRLLADARRDLNLMRIPLNRCINEIAAEHATH